MLTIAADGSMTSEVRWYGLYGLGKNDVAAYSRIVGTYAIVGDSLMGHPDHLVYWDYYFGADSPEQTEDVEGPETRSRFEVSSGQLTLHYLSYPADGPVESMSTYHRAQ